MDNLINVLSAVEWPTLIGVGAMVWMFYNRLNTKIDKLSEKMDDRFKEQDTKWDARLKEQDTKWDARIGNLEVRFDKLEDKVEKLGEKVNGIDCRLYRLEGTLMNKDCCVLKEDDHRKKKAE